MLNGKYFYNQTIPKVITVFGTMFNNIHIARRDGDKITNVQRVRIAYGPSKKFLGRINAIEKGQVAIQLPRISYEITSIQYNTTSKLNKLNKTFMGSHDTGDLKHQYQSVPYDINITLSVYGNTQDDIFQIIEQIIPSFTPEFVVTIKGLVNEESKTDVPFILQGVNIEDNYEGDFVSRRAIIHTLDFVVKVNFGGYVNDTNGVIEEIDLNFYDKLQEDFTDDSPAALDPLETVNITDTEVTIT